MHEKWFMDGRGSWRGNVFVERLSLSMKYDYVPMYAMTVRPKNAPRSPPIWIGTTQGESIRAFAIKLLARRKQRLRLN